MLKTRYTCLRWEWGGAQYIIDMDNIKGVRFQPAREGNRANVQLHMGEGVTYCMEGETAETFADWYWRTHGDGGYKVPDLDIP
jgi:hypothetical protein